MVSSVRIPMMFRPLLPYFSWNSMNHGISILQGPHQVAQKSSRITLPLNAESFTSLLFRSLSVKLRFAGLALAGHEPPAANAPREDQGSAGSVNTASASALTVARVHRVLIVILTVAPPERTTPIARSRVSIDARAARM